MGQTVDLGNCGTTTATNPKQDLWTRSSRSKSAMSLFDVQNPILEECKDDRKMEGFFKRWPFVPYAGNRLQSGHKLLSFYTMLYKLSPTHGACINKKTAYSVGGRVKIVRALDPTWNIPSDNVDVSTADQIRYRDSINQYIDFKDGLQSFHRTICNNFQAIGEAYVEMSVSTVMGQTKISCKVHGRENVLPGDIEDLSFDVYGISKQWDEDYLKTHDPRLVPAYPEFTQDEDGVLHTMFFLKNGDAKYHGRPASESADIYKYREVQDSIYVTKQAANSFTGTMIIEVEGGEVTDAIDNEGAQAAGFEDFASQFQDNYSQKSDRPQGVVLTERPFGSTPMKVEQIKPNTNERFYDVMGDRAIGYITRAHNVTPRFIGQESSNGFSDNAYLQDYLTNVEPAIADLRETITDFTNGIINSAWDYLGMTAMKEYSITFDNPIQAMIDAFKTQQIGTVTGQTMIPNGTNNTL